MCISVLNFFVFVFIFARVYCDGNAVINVEDIQSSSWSDNFVNFSHNVLEGWRLLNIVQWILLRQFITYNNVATYVVNVPEDLSSAVFTFRAMTMKVSGIGPDCDFDNVTVHLKYGGYPVVSQLPFPPNFYDPNIRPQINSLEFPSDTLSYSINVETPRPGNYFVIAFKSWMDTSSQQIQQQGISTVCSTYLYSETVIKKEEVKTVNCESVINIDSYSSKYYVKCLSDSDLNLKNFTFSLKECIECHQKLIMINKHSIPSADDNIVACLVVSTADDEHLYSVEILSQPSAWYYIVIEDIVDTAGLALCDKRSDFVENFTVIDTYKEVSTDLFRYRFGVNGSSDIILNLNAGEVSIIEFSVDVDNDIGGTLTISTKVESNVSVVMCLRFGTVFIASQDGRCLSQNSSFPATLILENSETKFIHVPYPEIGSWFATFSSLSVANITVHIESAPCILGDCGTYGTCTSFLSGGFLYSSCRCHMDYGGWDCTNDLNAMTKSEVIIATLLLTLSNLFFIPSIYFAIRRNYRTEATIYFLTMTFSIFYHSCDSGEAVYSFCVFNGSYNILQYGDFYLGLMSFWFTLVAMASLSSQHMQSFLHAIGGVTIAIMTSWDRFSLYTFIIPITVGLGLVALSWTLKMWKQRRLYPSKFYWMYCFSTGIILAITALICFAFLQTNQNYKYVHSLWHILVAMSVFCLLPDPKRFYPKSDLTHILPFTN